MMLDRLADYLRRRGSASLSDIALYLDADESAVRQMLGFWERKGKVRALGSGASCSGGCGRCALEARDYFAWHDHLAGVSVNLPRPFSKN